MGARISSRRATHITTWHREELRSNRPIRILPCGSDLIDRARPAWHTEVSGPSIEARGVLSVWRMAQERSVARAVREGARLGAAANPLVEVSRPSAAPARSVAPARGRAATVIGPARCSRSRACLTNRERVPSRCSRSVGASACHAPLPDDAANCCCTLLHNPYPGVIAADRLGIVGRGPSKKARAAARRLQAAHAALARARIAFANATTPEDAHTYDDAAHAKVRRVLRKHRARLLKIPGVVGVAVGVRTLGTTPLDELAVIVAVSHKRSPAQLAGAGLPLIPSTLRSGRVEVPTDVVQIGRFRRHAAAGTEVAVASEIGTIGIFAGDVPSARPVMITAMHLTGIAQYPGGEVTAPFATSRDGRIGLLLRGRTTGIDAAKFAVDDVNMVNNFVPGIGQVRRWRPTIPSDDRVTTVVMRGAVSDRQVGTIINHCFDVPELGLSRAILVRIHTDGGDSGAPLVDLQKNLLGFHVAGNDEGLALFSSAADVFSALRCNL